MNGLELFSRQQYLNLETIRKSGEAVRTPVWFVRDMDTLYVRTMANSGKVKRIRNNSNVKIAPCKMDGALLGEWIPALAHEVKDIETDRKVDRLLDKKYGLMKKLFYLMGALRRRKNTKLIINPLG